ncbi:hypothetical protein MTF65_13105 [Streptomyces sp. APSN-46.1]|uniref:hypothetical protein n=1 Tax=Streptomyces sp. APSN-46.1 TaxID=2929049 RepID=UPI001FB1C7BA|nr:hypothetical protein [Streptomyces sp. APSN-46.1]MCJ1678267.1 hypothetical protein [Streptomyces sp. APSN-46.1]
MRWDSACGFLDEDTLIAGTAGWDEEFGEGRHWLLDAHHLTVSGQITYSSPPSGAPTALGDATWATLSEDRTTVRIWTLD